MKKKDERIDSVDLLRILAIALIIGFHFFYERYHNNSLRIIGFLGVSLFFIISGFILAKRYPKQESFSFRWFFKRFVKIALLYYAALVLIVLLFSKQTYSGGLGKNLVYHFLFLDFLSSDVAYGIISPAWFVVPLVGLYALFPYLNKFSKKSNLFLFGIFVVMVATRIYYGTYTAFNPLFFIGEFCFGIACANDNKNKALLISMLSIIVFPFMVFPFLIFFVTFSLDWNYLPHRLFSFLGANTLALFLFHEAFIKIALGKWQINPLNKANALFLLSVAAVSSVYFSHTVQKFIFREKAKDKKGLKRDKGYSKIVEEVIVLLVVAYSCFLVYSVISDGGNVALSPERYTIREVGCGNWEISSSGENSGKIFVECRPAAYPSGPFDKSYKFEMDFVGGTSTKTFNVNNLDCKKVRLECSLIG
jgi:peptidoglycan/LPS O-acetylase OafA/YrhL